MSFSFLNLKAQKRVFGLRISKSKFTLRISVNKTISNQWKPNYQLGSNGLKIYEEFIGLDKKTGETYFSGLVCNNPISCVNITSSENNQLVMNPGTPNTVIYQVTNFDGDNFIADSINVTDCNGYFKIPFNPSKKYSLIFSDGKCQGFIYTINKGFTLKSKIEKQNFVECN